MKINCMNKTITSFLIILAFFASSTSLLFATKKSSKKASASFIGKWVFHSIQNMDPNAEAKFLTAEELLKQLPDHIDKNDAKAMAEFIILIHSMIEISEDGNLYFVSPIPEGITQEEIDSIVTSGAITLHDGMIMLDKPIPWEDRNGELWIQTKTEEGADGKEKPYWEKCEIVGDILTIAIICYQRAK